MDVGRISDTRHDGPGDTDVFMGDEMAPEVPMTTQERAYTSPVWHTPGGDG